MRQEDRPIHHEDRARDHDDADVAMAEHCRRPGMGRHPRYFMRVFAVAEALDLDLERQRRKARRIDCAAEGTRMRAPMPASCARLAAMASTIGMIARPR